jgi:Bifunctional DNA primase/polymerase, N-terminal
VSARREDANVRAAQAYAAAGWPVFPCVAGEKIPATKNGLLDATTDPDRIAHWWGRNPARNVAIATGAPGPDVLDVDHHGEAGNGFAAFNRLKREGLVGQPRALVRTPSGGFHAYYTGTGQRNGKITGQHLDYRAQGGYVVAPPSAVGGRPYEVVSHQPSKDTFDWTAAKQLLEPERPREPQRDADRPRDVGHLAGWVAGLEEGNRNDGLFWAANRAIEAGHSDALDALARAAQSAGLTEAEADRTIRSALRGAEPPFAQRQADAEAGA